LRSVRTAPLHLERRRFFTCFSDFREVSMADVATSTGVIAASEIHRGVSDAAETTRSVGWRR